MSQLPESAFLPVTNNCSVPPAAIISNRLNPFEESEIIIPALPNTNVSISRKWTILSFPLEMGQKESSLPLKFSSSLID